MTEEERHAQDAAVTGRECGEFSEGTKGRVCYRCKFMRTDTFGRGMRCLKHKIPIASVSFAESCRFYEKRSD